MHVRTPMQRMHCLLCVRYKNNNACNPTHARTTDTREHRSLEGSNWPVRKKRIRKIPQLFASIAYVDHARTALLHKIFQSPALSILIPLRRMSGVHVCQYGTRTLNLTWRSIPTITLAGQTRSRLSLASLHYLHDFSIYPCTACAHNSKYLRSEWTFLGCLHEYKLFFYFSLSLTQDSTLTMVFLFFYFFYHNVSLFFM